MHWEIAARDSGVFKVALSQCTATQRQLSRISSETSRQQTRAGQQVAVSMKAQRQTRPRASPAKGQHQYSDHSELHNEDKKQQKSKLGLIAVSVKSKYS